ncbi:hypothetical protein NLJ89_g11036 [Agrocybe chaxingu]|uniref:Uncharacterized protein n=1 Tax=Agrocybe chaxingu TaxID=84603 RepID=A0A9W8MQC6_9AGAR|nr:hypothetical protein NLJ89_g11036 [Agrocybe chaxingu]
MSFVIRAIVAEAAAAIPGPQRSSVLLSKWADCTGESPSDAAFADYLDESGDQFDEMAVFAYIIAARTLYCPGVAESDWAWLPRRVPFLDKMTVLAAGRSIHQHPVSFFFSSAHIPGPSFTPRCLELSPSVQLSLPLAHSLTLISTNLCHSHSHLPHPLIMIIPTSRLPPSPLPSVPLSISLLRVHA